MFKSIKVGGRSAASTLVLARFDGAGLDKASAKLDEYDYAAEAIERPESTGAAGEVTHAFPYDGDYDRILVLGLGKKASFTPNVLHNAAASLGKHMAKAGVTNVQIEITAALSDTDHDLSEVGRALGESLGLLSWSRDEFKGSAAKPSPARKALTIRSDDADFTKGVEFGLGLAESTNFARTLSETPPNICTPEWVAKQCKAMARKAGLKFSVVEFDDMKKEGLTGLWTVGQASENKPVLIRLEYTPGSKASRSSKPAVLVGKTMPYDSGGLSIKVGGGMRGMKRDMDGGAGVIGAMHAIGTVIKPKRRVVAYLCAAENAISDEAYRPDDIITYANGVTVEVTNTDAEGRLVLADGLIRAMGENPAYVVDMATLTGGVVVALGSTFAGMWCDHDKLRGAVEASAERTGDRVWRLPHHDEYRELMRSPVADILNSAPVRAAHPIQGAAFLDYFVDKKVPWCHLDIAGVHGVEGEKGPYAAHSCTGFGVRLLADLADRM